MAMVELLHVRKEYGEVSAVSEVSFAVQAGEAFGLLGPNGAGKSTLIRMISTLEVPTSGTITVAGYPVQGAARQVRRKIGVALQETGTDPLMTGQEILMIAGRLFGLTAKVAQMRSHALLERFGLTDVAHRRVGSYSGGMRRRLDLAAALVHDPEIIVLDEPTTGLDPVNRDALWELLRTLSHVDHKTLIMTTQYLEEADALCDRVAFINGGRMVAEGNPEDLKREMGWSVIRFSVADSEQESLRLAACLGQQAFRYVVEDGVVAIDTQNPEQEVFRLADVLAAEGFKIGHLEVRPPTLDDVFLHLTAPQRRSDWDGVLP
jgi:ABC-2 type transport system ATP-binding protein